TLAAAASVGHNSIAEKTDPKVSLLISNTFADDTLGALVSVSYSERNIKDQGASTVRWDHVNDFGTYAGTGGSLEEINDGFRPRIPRYDSYTHELERLGVSASFQWRPTDVTPISLDAL